MSKAETAMGKENLAAFGPAGPEITGYEVWQETDDTDHCMALYVSDRGKTVPRRYKIQYTEKGRPFIRPAGCRLYLDGIV